MRDVKYRVPCAAVGPLPGKKRIDVMLTNYFRNIKKQRRVAGSPGIVSKGVSNVL